MKTRFMKIQKAITRVFLWTSVPAFLVLLSANFPSIEKSVWETPVLAPVLAFCFVVWFLSLIFVACATFVSSDYKENILQDVVLRTERDERESLLSGQAAKKSILVTLVASVLILIATTGQYNKAETPGKSSVTIGNFRLSDDNPIASQEEDGSTIIHHQLPMSKMSLVLLLILIQLSSYHAINFLNLRKLE